MSMKKSLIGLVQEIMNIVHRMTSLVNATAMSFMIQLLSITSATSNIVTTGTLASGKLMIIAVIKEKK